VKSTEAVTTELVSFLPNDKPVVTCHMPEESMAALSLYDDGLGEIDAFSNQERLTSVVEKHLSRLGSHGVNVMNEEGAIKKSEERSTKVVKHFQKLGLIRPLLAEEVPKLQASRQKHAAEFDPYTGV
jgi:hypothetical protein